MKKLIALFYNVQPILLIIGAILGFFSGLLMFGYNLQHPELTHMQVFLEYIELWVIAIVLVLLSMVKI